MISLIIARQNSDDDVRRCVESFRQAGVTQIILADGVSPAPNVQVDQHVRLEGASLPMLLGAGMIHATGDIIAITESHCVAAPTWAQSVIAAHQATDQPVIGGAVDAGDGLGFSDWGLYFADYGQFMTPLKSGATSEVPGENVSFKREIVAQHLETFVRDGFYKTLFCQSLQAKGIILLADPSIVVTYHRRMAWGAIAARRFTHGRCFGGMVGEKMPTSARIMRVVGDLLLPFVITWRLLRRVIPKKRLLGKFVLTSPVWLTAIFAWSAGEWVGNAFGAGDSCKAI